MVERLLRMREALGSIPRISSLFFLIQTRLLNEMAILLVYRVVVCLFLIIFCLCLVFSSFTPVAFSVNGLFGPRVLLRVSLGSTIAQLQQPLIGRLGST